MLNMFGLEPSGANANADSYINHMGGYLIWDFLGTSELQCFIHQGLAEDICKLWFITVPATELNDIILKYIGLIDR